MSNKMPYLINLKNMLNVVGGIGDSPDYASGGGTIFNRTQFIDSYERH